MQPLARDRLLLRVRSLAAFGQRVLAGHWAALLVVFSVALWARLHQLGDESVWIDEAISFVNWITSPEVQAVYAKNFGLLPANKLATDVAYYSPDATAAVKGIQQDLENSPRYAATDQAWPEMQAGVWDAVQASVTSVVSGQSTAEDAVAMLHAAAEAAITASK